MLKGLALIDMSLYRRFYRQKNTPFAAAGLRDIGSSSISFDHTGLVTAHQLPEVDAVRNAPRWAASWAVRSDSHFYYPANQGRCCDRPATRRL
jgi:hypothetical protein